MDNRKKTNQQYRTDSGYTLIPYRTGDIRFSQDRIMDMRYIEDFVGNIIKNLIGQIPVIFKYVGVRKGTGSSLNIDAGHGYAKFSVEIPDAYGTPFTKQSVDLDAKLIEWSTQTDLNASSSNCSIFSIVEDSSTINYVKVKYLEENGNTRAREKLEGSYAYESIDSFDFIINTTAPTDYELCLKTFTSDGSTYTFSEYENHKFSMTGIFSNLRRYYISKSQIGNTLSLAKTDLSENDEIGVLDEETFVIYSPETQTLSTYLWNGDSLSQIGSSLSLTADVFFTILNSTTIALVGYDEDLKTYEWSGSAWSQIGNGYSVTYGFLCMETLTENTIAIFNYTEDTLKTYEWDGTDWTQIGNSLSFVEAESSMTKLNSTTICLLGTTNDELTTFQWDGTDWTQIGNQSNFGITIANENCIAALDNCNIIISTGSGDNNFFVATWDGTNWSRNDGTSRLGATGYYPRVCKKINQSTIFYCDCEVTTDQLAKFYIYRIGMGL